MHYWYFLISPSWPPADSRECLKIESWGPGLHSFEASKHEFWVLCSIYKTSEKNIIFWYHPQGQHQAQEGVGKWNLEALASRVWELLTSMLCILFNIQAHWKKTIYFLMPPQGLFLAQEGVEKWAPEASNGIHHCKAFNTNFWYFVQYLALTPTTGGIMQMAYNNLMMEIRK